MNSFFESRKPLLRWSAWFLIGNILFFWIIALRYLSNSVFVVSSLGELALLATLPTLFLTLPLIIFFSRAKQLIFTSTNLINSFAITLLLIDTIIYEQYHFHISSTFIRMFLDPYGQQIFHFSWLEYSLLGLLFVFILLIEIKLSNYIWRNLIQRSCLWAFIFISITLAFGLITYNFPNLVSKKNNLHHINLSQLEFSKQSFHYPLHALSCSSNVKPLNLVIIVIDSWRYDMINPMVTPHLTNFAKHNWQFTQHSSGGNATQPGIFSLFYGLPANYWEATIKTKRGPVLIDEMLKQHYQTGIFASAALSIPAFNSNVFRAIKNLQLVTPGNNAYERDIKITQEFQQFIQFAPHKKQPFFAFLFYDAAHNYCENGNPIKLFQPAAATCNRLAVNNLTNPALYFNRYKNNLYFIDRLLSKVLTGLAQQHLLDNTVVIITGDHGNEFNDSHMGYWGHDSNFTHYQVQTPLLIHWPRKAAATINYPTSHYDIAPTLLADLFRCQNPINDYSIGRSLLSKQKQAYLLVHSYTNFGIIEPSRMTTISPTGDYQIDNFNGQPLPNAKLHLDIFQQLLSDMRRYYSND